MQPFQNNHKTTTTPAIAPMIIEPKATGIKTYRQTKE
jgi:hypothetical protein